MPLIPFPNVPPLPGVPNLRRAATGVLVRTGIAPAIMGLDRFGLLSRFLGPQWGVFSASGGAAKLVPDTIASIEFKGDSDIANHPVEQGGFASYNKVAKPFEVSVVMTCSGGGQQSRSDFLSALKDMRDNLELYDVVTPDGVHTSCNLVHYDYKRSSQNGVTMITANCRFQEVRETAVTVFSETAKPDGAGKEGGGSVTASPADKGATAAAGSKAVQ